MTSNRSNRKVKNLVIDSGLQLRMFYPYAALLAINFITIVVFDQRVKRIAEDPSFSLGFNGSEVYKALASDTRMIAAVSLIISSLATFVLWLRYSHKIAGPQVALSRQLQKLIASDYESRLRLRNGDEFQEIARQINELSEKLASLKGTQEKMPG